MSLATDQRTFDVLVVDDTHDNLRLLSKVLTKQGYGVRPAPNARLALAAAIADPPDLILLDINMPEMNGFEVCEALKKNPLTQDIPIIFVSALGETFNKVKAFDVGGVDYVTKPFQIEEVLARVATHLELRGLQKILERQNETLSDEVKERKRAQANLEVLNAELDTRVKQRTRELQLEVEERRNAELNLLHLAFHDSLTDLPNRQSFLQTIEDFLGFRDFAVLVLDLDGFKVFNDSLGPDLGDELLKVVAQRFLACKPDNVILARLGGDEFAFLLPDADEAAATDFSLKLLDCLKEPLKLEASELYLNASIGICIGEGNYTVPSHVLRDADTAMYKAKLTGKGNYQLFDISMQESAQERLQLESDLRQALELDLADQQLELYFQPIVSLRETKVVAFEALLRWSHPEKGMISPAKFIPIAEETGLIQRLGWWVLRSACRQINLWQKELSEDICVNVNLSTLQLKQPQFLEQFRALLVEHHIQPHNLKVEVTESAILDDANLLNEISNLGIAICIDDFGVGYSSLSRLQEFPIHTIKIDRSFVMKLEQSQQGAAMAAMIIAMAKGLKCEVVAEGIETQKQLERLQLLSCQLGQGYLFSKPVNAQAAQLLYKKVA
ncbi:MAG: EAL domain-containing protein [Trueperaceae bacterium]|nr:EAL domain-containing protein [Trueperaceae bacterium]